MGYLIGFAESSAADWWPESYYTSQQFSSIENRISQFLESCKKASNYYIRKILLNNELNEFTYFTNYYIYTLYCYIYNFIKISQKYVERLFLFVDFM